jgi:hypothetical protein
MECVTTVQYSIKLNNESLDSFKPSCGLRQGNPLSPYLFLFVGDGLLKLMQHEVHNGRLHELHVCWQAPGIPHLLLHIGFYLVHRGTNKGVERCLTTL